MMDAQLAVVVIPLGALAVALSVCFIRLDRQLDKLLWSGK